MAKAKSQYAMYLTGEPLTEELEELQNGPKEEPAYQRTPVRGEKRQLDEGEIRSLRALRDYPAWSIMLNLLDSRVEQFRQEAILLSETDPVGNMAAASKAWVYVNAWKAVRSKLDSVIDDAIQGEKSVVEAQAEGEGDDSGVE